MPWVPRATISITKSMCVLFLLTIAKRACGVLVSVCRSGSEHVIGSHDPHVLPTPWIIVYLRSGCFVCEFAFKDFTHSSSHVVVTAVSVLAAWWWRDLEHCVAAVCVLDCRC
jgi:hypothetical protein